MALAITVFTNQRKLSGLITAERVKKLELTKLPEDLARGFTATEDKRRFEPLNVSHNIVAVSDFAARNELDNMVILRSLVANSDDLLILRHGDTEEGPSWIMDIRGAKNTQIVAGDHSGDPGKLYREVFGVLLDQAPDKIVDSLAMILTGDPILEGKLHLLHALLAGLLNAPQLESEFTKRIPKDKREMPKDTLEIPKDDPESFGMMQQSFKTAIQQLSQVERNSDTYRKHFEDLRNQWLGDDK
jgi:hypothetical protein